MKTFYIELFCPLPDGSLSVYSVQARTFDEAALIAGAYLAGVRDAGGDPLELRAITQTKRRGVEVGELL
jgi:hypothetical protein